VLGVCCAALGLAPFAIIPQLGDVIAGLDGMPRLAPSFALNMSLRMPGDFAQISPTLAALGLLIVLGCIPLALLALRVNRTRRISDSWGCGRVGQTPRMEYTATAFAEPLRRVFAELYRPTKELTIDFHPESKYFVQSIAFKSVIRSWFDEFLYEPLLQGIRWASEQIRRVQSGSLHGYMTYLFIALVVLLGALLLPGQ
jgi:hydrogenase-4 component B